MFICTTNLLKGLIFYLDKIDDHCISFATSPSDLLIFATMRIAKKIVNVLLAILLLIATTGVTLNKHYCMGRLKSVAVNAHANHCFEGEAEQMPCCKDVSQELKVEEITTVGFDFDAHPDLYELFSITSLSFDDVPEHTDQTHVQFLHYSPPLPDRDVIVLVQSFLI